jgi:ribosome production factor 1
MARFFASLFPQRPEFKGRQVVTFHNQRDFIFFRRHRYEFREEKSKVAPVLQEIGPRFTLKLDRIQHGTFDNKFGELEWAKKDDMYVSRTAAYL